MGAYAQQSGDETKLDAALELAVGYEHHFMHTCNHSATEQDLKIDIILSITAPQDPHKLVLQVAEWLTASLSGLARHELTTHSLVQALKNK